jgi:hypothetical protein
MLKVFTFTRKKQKYMLKCSLHKKIGQAYLVSSSKRLLFTNSIIEGSEEDDLPIPGNKTSPYMDSLVCMIHDRTSEEE